MEVLPENLRAVARSWDGVALDLAEAASTIRGAPRVGLGSAAGEAALLLDAAEAALAGLRDEADRLVDGLLLTARMVTDVDDRVAGALARIGAGRGP